MTVTTEFEAIHACWFAYEGTTDTAQWIGQGQTREDALTDYWAQRHPDGKALSYVPAGPDGWHTLTDGTHSRLFQTREAALEYADLNQWRLT
jgi:hypothetical protein